jgi:hypothetical protein
MNRALSLPFYTMFADTNTAVSNGFNDKLDIL